MQRPLQIAFRNMRRSLAVEADVRRRARKLEQRYQRIQGCRVVLELPHKHQTRGRRFHVRMDIRLPGGELIVHRGGESAEEDLFVAIRNAFRAAHRELETFIGRRGEHVAIRETAPSRAPSRRVQAPARRPKKDNGGRARTTEKEDTLEATSLPIAVRLVLDGSGELHRLPTVFCPLDGRSRALEHCASCRYCAGAPADVEAPDAFVACTLYADTGTEPDAWSVPLPSRDPSVSPLAVGAPTARAMTADVVCVHEDVELESIRNLMLERGISGLPVVDAELRPLGMVSKTDLVFEDAVNGGLGEESAEERERVEREVREKLGNSFHAQQPLAKCARDLMTPLACTVEERVPVSAAAARMVGHELHRLPVVSPDGDLVGVLAATDVLRWLVHHGAVPGFREKPLASDSSVRPIAEARAKAS